MGYWPMHGLDGSTCGSKTITTTCVTVFPGETHPELVPREVKNTVQGCPAKQDHSPYPGIVNSDHLITQYQFRLF